MESHVKILAWVYLIYGGLLALVGLLVFGLMGGVAGIVGASGDPEAGTAGGILVVFGGLIFGFFAVIALPSIAAGWGLLQHAQWARILTIVLCVLNLWAFPIGTAIAVYGLWVLLNSQTAPLFSRS